MSAGELEHEWAGTPGKLIRERYRRAAEVSRVRGKLSCLLINDIDAGIGHFDNTQVGAFCLHGICVQLGFVEMGRLSSAVPQPSCLLINDIGAGHFDNTQVAVPQTVKENLWFSTLTRAGALTKPSIPLTHPSTPPPPRRSR